MKSKVDKALMRNSGKWKRVFRNLNGNRKRSLTANIFATHRFLFLGLSVVSVCNRFGVSLYRLGTSKRHAIQFSFRFGGIDRSFSFPTPCGVVVRVSRPYVRLERIPLPRGTTARAALFANIGGATAHVR